MKKTIVKSKKTKVRDSNMELLRIVAMILVMVVHADFRALGWPSTEDIGLNNMLPRFLVESFSIICVDTFVLLSGWYGIRFKWNRLGELFFQVLFFLLIGVGIWFLTVRNHQESYGILIRHLLLFGNWDYWFVKCYVLLYVFSPILNAFVENCTKRQFLAVLVMFFVMQTYLGWITDGVKWYADGYSGISFMGLYLLSRFIRLHPNALIVEHKLWFYLFVYVALAVLNGLLAYYVFISGHIALYKRLFYYINPLVIIQAIAFLLFFSKLEFKSRIINWIAISSFAIYLLHSSFAGELVYDGTISAIYKRYSHVSMVFLVTIFLVIVFVTSILLDKLRLYFWKKLIIE
ncbi:MAG: acyltransferase family protein [Prevotella sp.]|nr:acyltransferase family protein [Prevotella sp.]